MINKKCACGANATIHVGSHEMHHLHTAHRAYESLKHSGFMRTHPIATMIGGVALGGLAIAKLFEKHQYRCERGHLFEA